MSEAGMGTSLRGISTRINGRHAFVHERVLELIARETKRAGEVRFSQAELAKRMGCCSQSLARAVTRLRREGLITSTPVYSESGAQLGNSYKATPAGIERAEVLAHSRRG
ncbi:MULTISPECIES: helix-turn-helix domain-containing protein [Enorma]|uniref:MarR family transcriptional regulator n=1 Tax=[Collinsella] massiliensis TaxID=1232426 RepID=A0A1Y3XVU2_9ACTN|nr:MULTISPECIES: helix-turn-helix domain-containing protein [Enorma]OUN89683.1 MarR family transcriptional regulator [[Collinsella] massiliensis]